MKNRGNNVTADPKVIKSIADIRRAANRLGPEVGEVQRRARHLLLYIGNALEYGAPYSCSEMSAVAFDSAIDEQRRLADGAISK